jgi:hypothetical protein
MKAKQLGCAPDLNEGKIWKNYWKFVSGLYGIFTTSYELAFE